MERWLLEMSSCGKIGLSMTNNKTKVIQKYLKRLRDVKARLMELREWIHVIWPIDRGIVLRN